MSIQKLYSIDPLLESFLNQYNKESHQFGISIYLGTLWGFEGIWQYWNSMDVLEAKAYFRSWSYFLIYNCLLNIIIPIIICLSHLSILWGVEDIPNVESILKWIWKWKYIYRFKNSLTFTTCIDIYNLHWHLQLALTFTTCIWHLQLA